MAAAQLWLLGDVLTPFVLAGVLAFIFEPLVAWLARRGLPRGVAAAVVLALLLAALASLLLLILPLVIARRRRPWPSACRRWSRCCTSSYRRCSTV
jgi:predicted PurR-regulated permease PerM